MNSPRIWWIGARPRTLPAAIAPVLIGSAYAGADFSALDALASLIVALSLQIAVNYANDYSDGIRGTDENRVGPTRLVASGLATAASVKRAAMVAFAVAILAGGFLALRSSLALLAIGALAIIAAWRYTGGKRPYGYRGLGEVAVFIFFGLVATMGTFYVQSERVDFTIFLLGVAMGSIACSILILNNIRDLENDANSGKRTLSVRIGRRNSERLYTLLIAIACAVFFLIPAIPWNFLLLIAAPLLMKITRARSKGEMIKSLELTGKFQLAYASLLALALLLA